jgi:hypothetical protein
LRIAFDRSVQRSDLNQHSLRVLRREQQDSLLACWCEIPFQAIVPGNFKPPCSGEFTPVADPLVNGVQISLPTSLIEPGEYRVIVNGDFIRDNNGKAVDADHLPAWFNSQGYHTGDGVAGGAFESWFTVQ